MADVPFWWTVWRLLSALAACEAAAGYWRCFCNSESCMRDGSFSCRTQIGCFRELPDGGRQSSWPPEGQLRYGCLEWPTAERQQFQCAELASLKGVVDRPSWRRSQEELPLQLQMQQQQQSQYQSLRQRLQNEQLPPQRRKQQQRQQSVTDDSATFVPLLCCHEEMCNGKSDSFRSSSSDSPSDDTTPEDSAQPTAAPSSFHWWMSAAAMAAPVFAVLLLLLVVLLGCWSPKQQSLGGRVELLLPGEYAHGVGSVAKGRVGEAKLVGPWANCVVLTTPGISSENALKLPRHNSCVVKL